MDISKIFSKRYLKLNTRKYYLIFIIGFWC